MGWCRAAAAKLSDDARETSRTAPDATRRRNARAVVVADPAVANESVITSPAARPKEEAAHPAFGGVGAEDGLVIHRALSRMLRAQHKALDFEYEVKWRAHNGVACGARLLSVDVAPRTKPLASKA